ncbi:MAG: Vms1/Ankzf1 family peptidyl-tRNA hydrolase [Solirubrobacterales bacterium]
MIRHHDSTDDQSVTELLEVDQGELRRINGMGHGNGRVLSLCLALDRPQVRSPHSVAVEIESGLDKAGDQLRASALDADAERALSSCLDRVRDSLEGANLLDHSLHAVAAFCEESGDLRTYALRRPTEEAIAAAFGERPAIELLLGTLGGRSWAVALVSRKHGRIFRGTESSLAEIGEAEDEVHRWHSQGGWSQARFQRGIEKEAEDHVEHVCDLLFALHRRQPLDRLVVGGPAEIWPAIDAGLHPYLRRRLAGHLPIDVDSATPESVLEHLQPLIRDDREQTEHAALEQLGGGLGTGDEAVAGLDEVRRALEDRRVATLLVSDVGLNEQIESAIGAALDQSAEIIVFENETLEPFGGIGALLRY